MAGLTAPGHPHPRRAVIGLGTGHRGWLARIPSMERVDVAELEPAILRVATMAAPVNGDAMRNPRLAIHLELPVIRQRLADEAAAWAFDAAAS
jgi:spermidine synthase